MCASLCLPVSLDFVSSKCLKSLSLTPVTGKDTRTVPMTGRTFKNRDRELLSFLFPCYLASFYKLLWASDLGTWPQGLKFTLCWQRHCKLWLPYLFLNLWEHLQEDGVHHIACSVQRKRALRLPRAMFRWLGWQHNEKVEKGKLYSEAINQSESITQKVIDLRS